MRQFKTIAAIAALVIGSIAGIASADDKSVVQKFYDLLSNPSSEQHAAAFKEVTGEGWESIGDYSGSNKTKEKFMAQEKVTNMDLILNRNVLVRPCNFSDNQSKISTMRSIAQITTMHFICNEPLKFRFIPTRFPV